MGKLTKLATCLAFLAPMSATAEEPRNFPPLKPTRIGPIELRASTTKRGLSMLRTEPLPPNVTAFTSALLADPPVVRTHIERDEVPYQGTKVFIQKGLEGDEAKAQEAFAARFPKVDPCPKARMAHFDWLPHYDDYPVRNLGWDAAVQRAEQDRDGAWTVTVHLKPRLHSRMFKSLIWDYVEETYRLEGDSVRLIASDAETPKPKAQFFPVAI